MESNKKEFQGDAAQSSGPRDPLQVLASEGSGLSATPAIAPAHIPSDEEIAAKFHATYEKLAPSFSYETRKASAKPWEEVPENNRLLMIATVREVRQHLREDSRAMQVEDLMLIVNQNVFAGERAMRLAFSRYLNNDNTAIK